MKSKSLGKVFLERALSKMGVASRSQSRKLINEGRVKVDGKVRLDPLFLVTPEKAKIEIDESLVKKAEMIVLLLHKPRGLVTTRSDEKGRPTVFSLIRSQDRYLHAVGRLDLATSGLLLLTNDTRLSDWLTDPKNGIERVYAVSVRGEFTEDKSRLIKDGIRDENEVLQASKVLIRKVSGKESHLTVTLTQGKNREIRRLFKALGHDVIKLKRISFAGLNLGDLQPGEYRELTQEEIKTISSSQK